MSQTATNTPVIRPQRIHRNDHAANWRNEGTPYESIDRAILMDGRISSRAIGRLIRFLALPPNFEVHVRGVRHYHDGKMKTDLFPSNVRFNGTKTILSDLKELRKFGLAQHYTLHCNRTGRVIRGIWAIYETPRSNCCDMTQIVNIDDKTGKITAYGEEWIRGSRDVRPTQPQPQASSNATAQQLEIPELMSFDEMCAKLLNDSVQLQRLAARHGDRSKQTWSEALVIFGKNYTTSKPGYEAFADHFYNSAERCFKILKDQQRAAQKATAPAVPHQYKTGYKNGDLAAIEEALTAQRAAIINFGITTLNGDNSFQYFEKLCKAYIERATGVKDLNAQLSFHKEILETKIHQGKLLEYYHQRAGIKDVKLAPPVAKEPPPLPPPQLSTGEFPRSSQTENMGDLLKGLSLGQKMRAKIGTPKPPDDDSHND